jgi:hypothetical protein
MALERTGRNMGSENTTQPVGNHTESNAQEPSGTRCRLREASRYWMQGTRLEGA